mgnify:CR=1 FL=1
MLLPVFLISLAVYKEFYNKRERGSRFFIFLAPILVDVFSGRDFGFVFSSLAFLFVLIFFAFKFISCRKIYYILVSSILVLVYPVLALFLEKAVREKDFFISNFITAKGFITAFLLTYLFFLVFDRFSKRSKIDTIRNV